MVLDLVPDHQCNCLLNSTNFLELSIPVPPGEAHIASPAYLNPAPGHKYRITLNERLRNTPVVTHYQ